MKKLVSLAVISFLSISLFAQQTTWKVDKAHSKLAFTVTHLSISDVDGSFKNFDATINAAKTDFSDAVFELSADVVSINTDMEMRDNHLKGPDYFNVEKFPKLTFKSTSIQKTGKNKFKLVGNLTIHGITKQVTLDLVHKGTIENPMNKKTTSGFQLTGTIKRGDFDLAPKTPSAILSNEVKIKADGEFTK